MTAADKVQRVEFGTGTQSAREAACTLDLDAELRVSACSENCQEILGLAEERLLGRGVRQIFDLNLLQTLLAEGYAFCSQPVPLGRKRLLGAFRPEAGQGGGRLTLSRVQRDDPEVPALQEVLVSVDPYLDLERDAAVLVDRDGRIVLAGRKLAELLEVPAAELIERPAAELRRLPPLAALGATLKSGRTEVVDQQLADGRELVISRWPVEKAGEIVGAFGKVLFRPQLQEVPAAEKTPPYKEARSSPPPSTTPTQSFKYDANSIIGQSRVMRELKEKLLRVADRGSNVLLMGESGTGKELFAHAIHAASKRKQGPFIRVNCAAIPDHLLESELFGYVEGAFTGAKKGGQVGKFEQAHNGTIFLDEISDMPVPMQAKLLRVLQEKEVTPLGSTATRPINMRVIAATNVDLQQRVAESAFRTDLYYRLNIVALSIPPLRERVEDIYFIAKHMIDDFNAEFEMHIEGLEREAWEAIQRYEFPGNIRELRNAIESAFNVAMGQTIRLEDLPQHISRVTGPLPLHVNGQLQKSDLTAGLGRKSLQEIIEELEKFLIEQALQQTGGSKLSAAQLLGISRPGLYKKLSKYDLQ